jgi:hypothetical protein
MTDAARAQKPPVVVLYNENPDWPEADKDWAKDTAVRLVR